MTDPIADMITRIRNANQLKREQVDIPASNVKEEIAKVLADEGFVKGYKRIRKEVQDTIRVYLKYGSNEELVITGLKRISKPGLRVYANNQELPKVLGGLGTAIISTSHGVMPDRKARKEGVGGEVLCYIW